MKKTFFLLLAFLGTSLTGSLLAESCNAAGAPVLPPCELTVETRVEPIGIDAAAPRLAWKSKAVDEKSCQLKQEAYQILAASSLENLSEGKADLWDSGKVASDDSIQVEYKGKALQTSQRVYWKVRTWYQGQPSEWSKPSRWIMAVVKPSDWRAMWIAADRKYRKTTDLNGSLWIGAEDQKAKQIFLRRDFQLDLPKHSFDKKNFFAAFRYAGNKRFEIFVNGEKAGHSIGMVFNPDLLRTLDISDRLVPGKNVIAVAVSNDTPDPTAFLAKLEIFDVNKEKNANVWPEKVSRRGTLGKMLYKFGSDKNWTCSVKGEKNWQNVEFNASAWKNATEFFGADNGPWKVRRNDETFQPAFQKKFNVAKKVKYATLHISGLGFYEASLDGKRFSHLLDPPPTNYNKRVLYSTYDLTDQMTTGEHELNVVLGHSWYDVRSIVTWNFDASPWRDLPKLLAQLELEYTDGTKELVYTDYSWTFSNSPVLFDCLRQGEIVDGNYQQKILGNAFCINTPKGSMSANQVPPAAITEEFKPKSVSEVSPGVYVVDLGWNIAGWCRVKIKGAQKGDRIRFKYSERILPNGKIERHDIEQHFMEGSPSWMTGEIGGFQTDFYFCNGSKEEVFEPRFTFNGFQYLEITGLRQKPSIDDFVCCRVNNNFKQIGKFQCANDLFNKIFNATCFSYRANYVFGVPTDCPHREKNGWTADAHLSAELAMYIFENTAGYEKWIGDLLDEQQPDGNLPGIVPTGEWGYAWGNGPAWDSALCILPWYLYVYRGDKRILEKAWPAMQKYVEFCGSKATNNIVKHGLGDWVFAKTKTPESITSTGYYFLDVSILAQTAVILGKKEEAKKYFKLAEEIQKAYHQTQTTGNGFYGNKSQTSQATVLHQGLAANLDKAGKKAIFDNLVKAINAANDRIDFGVLGSKYVFRTLSEFGRTDLALKLALSEERPSFADWIKRGAGTLWEDWGEGSSRNHIFLGDICAWQFQYLGGIKLLGAPSAVIAQYDTKTPDGKKFDPIRSVAFRTFVIEPKCLPADLKVEGRQTIDRVNADFDSPYGRIVSNWKWNDKMTELTLNVEIPVNTNAYVVLPFEKSKIAQCAGANVNPTANEKQTIFFCGSGKYSFRVK